MYVDEYGDLIVINKYSILTKQKITSSLLSSSGLTILRKTITVMDNVIIGKDNYILYLLVLFIAICDIDR